MSKADDVRQLLAADPKLPLKVIATTCGCSVPWVSNVKRRMLRPAPSVPEVAARPDIETRLRNVEQEIRDHRNILNRFVKRSSARKNALNYAPPRRMSLSFSRQDPAIGKTYEDSND
jgi:hypothetical protein